MTDFTPAIRTKFIGVLGMLASEHDGERAAAALLASRILKQHGLQWDDVISGNGPPQSLGSWRSPTNPRGCPDLELCQRYLSFCRRWEQDFIQSVAHQLKLSRKQRIVVVGIADALRARGMA